MLPTPDISHLSREDYDHVYEPAEDTFLFLDALETEQDFLRELGYRHFWTKPLSFFFMEMKSWRVWN